MSDKKFQKKLAKMEKEGERLKQEAELKAKYEQYEPKKEKKKVSNIMLTIIVTCILAYTVASFWLTYATGASIDSTVTTCFFAFWGGEIISLATIKATKIIKGTDNKQNDAIEDPSVDWTSEAEDESEM